MYIAEFEPTSATIFCSIHQNPTHPTTTVVTDVNRYFFAEFIDLTSIIPFPQILWWLLGQTYPANQSTHNPAQCEFVRDF